jgi:hypothetical protein
MSRSILSAFLNLGVVVRVALAVIVVCSVDDGTSRADPTGAAGWENPPADLPECTSIDRSLIFAVPIAGRPEAIARLENVAIVEITAPQLHALLDLPAGTNGFGADQIKNEIGRLREQRRVALENHQGSWSTADRQRLDRLTTTMSDPTTSNLRPFLVRAVAKFEGTGAFFGSICGENLVILHGSLGYSIPPSIHVPVIVFLQKKPMTVYAGWRMVR